MPIWSVVAILLLTGSVAFADTYTVSNLNDSGPGSLRDAITQANATAAADTIDFSVTGVIALSTQLPVINNPVTIAGPIGAGGDPAVTLDGGGSLGSGLIARGVRGFSVLNLGVTGFTWTGIVLAYDSRADLRGNRVTNCTIGICVTCGSQASIEGNTIVGSPHAAINLQRYAPNNAAPTHATVKGNTITGGGVGVRCTDAEADIEGNAITGAVTAITVDRNAVTIVGNSLSELGGYGVQLMNGAVATIDDNDITDVGSYGIIGFGSGSGSVVTRNRVTRSAATAIGLDTGQVVTISENVLTDVGTGNDYGYGISVGAGVTDGTISGNTINRCRGTGIIVHHGAVTTIRDNELHDVWGPEARGLQAWLAAETTFSGNEVTDCRGPAIQVDDSAAGPDGEQARTTITGNAVNRSGGAGVWLAHTGPVVVTDNTVVSPDGDGIKASSCETATIRSNHVSDSGQVGLWAAGVETADISNNTVERTNQSGIQIESSGGSVVGNRISGAGIGVNLQGASGVEVRGNTITDGWIGVCSKCLSAGTVVQSNTIRGMSGAGVISVSYYDPSVPEDPLTVSICDNTVDSVGWGGIYTSGMEATVTGNHVSASGGAGITCAGGATAEVTDNTVTDTGGSGIDVQNITAGPITVSGNDVTEVIGTGIYVGSSPAAAVIATDNTVADVGANGLEVRSCGDATVSGNTVQRYAVSGVVAVLGPTALVENNEVSWGSGAGSGIWLAGVDATVRGNTITAGGWGGINACCWWGRALIEGNTVTGCSSGIGVHGGCVAQVRDNTVYGNHTGIAVAWPGSRATALISRNRTYDNAGLGIDLEWNGVTANDGARTPGTANELIDFPEIVGVDKSGGSLVLHCTAPPNTTVEVFQSDGDASGYGEGKTFLRAIEVDETGEFDLSVSSGDLPITMTASDLEAGITSEFSSWKLPVVADAGEDQTVEQASSAGTTVTLDASASVGSTGELTYTWREGEDILAGPTTEAQVDVTLNLGVHEIELTVQDGTGATSTDTVSVTVADTTAPNLTAPPAARAEQSSAAGTEVPLGEATVSDICDTDVTVTNDAPEVFPLGDTVVTWTAVDDSGNETTATQTVTVVDTTPPSITAPEGVSAEQASAAGTAVALGAPTVADLCDASPDITNDAPAVFPLGDTTVTWTATDASGNSATATQTVTIVDTTPPSLTAPATVAAEQASADGAAVDLGAPTVSDICDASPDVTNDAPAVFPLGPTLVTWTATDDSGNQAVAYQTVLVVDTTAPDFTLTQLQTTLWPPNHQMVLCATVSDVRDTCDAAPIVDIVVTANEPIDDPSAGPNADWQVVHNGGVWEIWLRAERAGSLSGRDYVINATVMDASGNQTIKGCIVTVPHDQKTR